MKKLTYFIVVFFVFFLLNIIFYFFNENYNFFIKKLKYGDKILENKSKIVTDDYLLDLSSLETKDLEVKNLETKDCICEPPKEIICKQDNLNNFANQPVVIEEKENQDFLKYKETIDLILSFFLDFNLKKKDYNEYYLIFGLTDEYPKEYETYLSDNLELYFFPGYSFIEMYNLFNLIKNELNISLNKTDTFGDNSFFINLNNPDGYVRLVIYQKNILFGLKFKKDLYNKIKNILKKI